MVLGVLPLVIASGAGAGGSPGHGLGDLHAACRSAPCSRCSWCRRCTWHWRRNITASRLPWPRRKSSLSRSALPHKPSSAGLFSWRQAQDSFLDLDENFDCIVIYADGKCRHRTRHAAHRAMRIPNASTSNALPDDRPCDCFRSVQDIPQQEIKQWTRQSRLLWKACCASPPVKSSISAAPTVRSTVPKTARMTARPARLSSAQKAAETAMGRQGASTGNRHPPAGYRLSQRQGRLGGHPACNRGCVHGGPQPLFLLGQRLSSWPDQRSAA